MKRIGTAALISVGMLFMGALSPLAPVAEQVRGAVNDMTTLLVRLNGVPRALGVLTSTGTSVTQSSTAAPFTLPGGTCFEITCNGSGVMNFGATAALAYTSANFGHFMTSGTSWYPCTRDGDTTLAFISTSGTVDCNVRTVR